MARKINDSHVPSDHSSEIGRRIAIAVESRNWCQARAILQVAEEDAQLEQVDPLTMAVAELPLEMRLVTGIEAMGAIMVSELLDLQPSEIESHPGFGRKSLGRIRKALREVGVDGSGTALHPSGI